MKNLEQLLTTASDNTLIEIQRELLTGVVPLGGAARTYCRRVNRLIIQGNLVINRNTFRRVYLPTLASAVQCELSRRYLKALETGNLTYNWSRDNSDEMTLEDFISANSDQ